VAVDWQEPMVLQRKLRPSIARLTDHFYFLTFGHPGAEDSSASVPEGQKVK